MRLASLPWYDLAEVHNAHDGLWEALARRLRAAGLSRVPERLERRMGYAQQWASGRLLLGQACGYDVAMGHASDLQIVATPRFDFEGCDGPHYRSFVVVRHDDPARTISDLRGRRCVINTETSHSGMNVLRDLVTPLQRHGRFFSQVVVSGAHDKSVAAVASGAADVAAIDCISWGLLVRNRPEALARLRILCRTGPAPAPPFVTSVSTPASEVAVLRTTLHDVLRAGSRGTTFEGLRLRGVTVLPPEAYEPIVRTARAAAEADYREFTFDAA
jgi:ABC-type phosphate/phosphonate transport system substrate-binding protein